MHDRAALRSSGFAEATFSSSRNWFTCAFTDHLLDTRSAHLITSRHHLLDNRHLAVTPSSHHGWGLPTWALMKDLRRCCDGRPCIVITAALPFQRKPTLVAPWESPRQCRYIFQAILSGASDGGGVRDRSHRVLVGSTSDRVARLSVAHATGELAKELRRLRRFPLLVIDEVGYLTSSRTLQSCSSNSSRRAVSTYRSS